MKPSVLLFGLFLIVAPLSAGWASHAQAAGWNYDPWDQRWRKDKDDDKSPPPPPRDDGQRRPQRPSDDRRDDGINRAIAAGQSRGRVLDAGSQGGSVYWVRVDTGHGRVDLLVDGATGRVIGEK